MRTLILFSLLLASAVRADLPLRHYAADQLPPVREAAPTELWRIGGFDDDFLLGVISGALVDEDGNVYLLDTQLSEVQVFDSEGNHLRTIGREGEGPGEFRFGGGLFWVDGNLCVVQRFPGRLVMFTKDGDPAGDLNVEGVQGMGGVQVAQVQGEHRVFAKASGRRTDNGFVIVQTLAAHDASGAEVAVLGRAEMERNMNADSMREDDEASFEKNWVLLPDGTVVLGQDRDHYRLQFFAPDGSERSVTSLDYALLDRTAAEKKDIASRPRFGMRGRGRGGRPEYIVREQHPVFEELRLGPDGRIWVLSSRGARPEAEGVAARYDVFDSAGNLVERVAVRAEASLPEDAIFFGSDHMIVVRGFADAQRAFFSSFGGAAEEEEEELEPEPLEVIVYRF